MLLLALLRGAVAVHLAPGALQDGALVLRLLPPVVDAVVTRLGGLLLSERVQT